MGDACFARRAPSAEPPTASSAKASLLTPHSLDAKLSRQRASISVACRPGQPRDAESNKYAVSRRRPASAKSMPMLPRHRAYFSAMTLTDAARINGRAIVRSQRLRIISPVSYYVSARLSYHARHVLALFDLELVARRFYRPSGSPIQRRRMLTCAC